MPTSGRQRVAGAAFCKTKSLWFATRPGKKRQKPHGSLVSRPKRSTGRATRKIHVFRANHMSPMPTSGRQRVAGAASSIGSPTQRGKRHLLLRALSVSILRQITVARDTRILCYLAIRRSSTQPFGKVVMGGMASLERKDLTRAAGRNEPQRLPG